MSIIINATMFRSWSSWLVPTQTPTKQCRTTTQRGVEPTFTALEASSMGHCGTVLLVVRYITFFKLLRGVSFFSPSHCCWGTHHVHLPFQVCQTLTTCTLIVWRSPWSSAVTNSPQRPSFTQNGRGIRKLCSVLWSLWVSLIQAWWPVVSKCANVYSAYSWRMSYWQWVCESTR